MTMHYDGLTKLIEECGELIQVASKKQAFFTTDKHPDGAGSLKRRLEEESADVIAACIFVVENFKLDQKFIEERVEKKLKRFRDWHNDPKV
mgnify:CR=1 FL=1